MNVVKTSKMKDGAEISSQMTLYASMFEASVLLKMLQCFADRGYDDHLFLDVVGTFTEAEQLTMRRIMWSLERS